MLNPVLKFSQLLFMRQTVNNRFIWQIWFNVALNFIFFLFKKIFYRNFNCWFYQNRNRLWFGIINDRLNLFLPFGNNFYTSFILVKFKNFLLWNITQKFNYFWSSFFNQRMNLKWQGLKYLFVKFFNYFPMNQKLQT